MLLDTFSRPSRTEEEKEVVVVVVIRHCSRSSQVCVVVIDWFSHHQMLPCSPFNYRDTFAGQIKKKEKTRVPFEKPKMTQYLSLSSSLSIWFVSWSRHTYSILLHYTLNKNLPISIYLNSNVVTKCKVQPAVIKHHHHYYSTRQATVVLLTPQPWSSPKDQKTKKPKNQKRESERKTSTTFFTDCCGCVCALSHLNNKSAKNYSIESLFKFIWLDAAHFSRQLQQQQHFLAFIGCRRCLGTRLSLQKRKQSCKCLQKCENERGENLLKLKVVEKSSEEKNR